MSYLVLARKWRPQSFESVVGQKPVVRTLQNALQRQRVAHAMIFSGVRGVGKTTLARLMAKALNCGRGTTPVPCNQCDSCLEITNGSAVDLHEIDGASNRGIQEIRELKENIRFFPSRGRYKVIIIDEVHMLTTEAFNALLKTLEEPPEHVIFMFATTELHKIPITILSRCQRYELKRVAAKELYDFFKKITDREKVDISDWALEQIVHEAGGSVRDGLSLLDQIFSFASLDNDTLKVTDDDITQVLGLVDRQLLASISAALLEGDLVAALNNINNAHGAGVELKKLNMELVHYFRSLIVCKTMDAPEELLEISDQEIIQLKKISDSCSIESLKYLFQLLLRGAEEMHFATNPRLALEMTCIKACQTGPVTPIDTLLGKIDALLEKDPGGEKTLSTKPPPPPVEKYAAPAEEQDDAVKKNIFTAEPVIEPGERPLTAAAEKKPAGPKEKHSPAVAAGQPPEKSATKSANPDTKKEIRRHWDEFVAYVKDRKEWMAQALRLCSGSPKEEQGDLVIKFDDPADCSLLQSADNMKNLTIFAQDFYQRELRLRIKVVGSAGSGSENGEGQASPQQERRALANDPLVQMALDILDGEVAQIRTGPRFR